MITTDILRQTEVFREFDEEKLRKIADFCTEIEYESGTILFKEKEKAEKIYILREGTIILRIQPQNREDVMVGTIRDKGEFFGWSTLIEPYIYTATAKCLEKSKVIVIEGNPFKELLEQEIHLGYKFMKKLAWVISSRLRDTRAQLISNLIQPVKITYG